MRNLILLAALLGAVPAIAQPSYSEWLKDVPLIRITDSISINLPVEEPPALSPDWVKNHVFPLYQEQHTTYGILGRILNTPDYDLLLLYQRKQYNDSSWHRVIFLCTLDPSGKLLHFQPVARSSSWKDNRGGQAFSWFYKDGSFATTTRIIAQGHDLSQTHFYTINSYGVMVYHPAWKR